MCNLEAYPFRMNQFPIIEHFNQKCIKCLLTHEKVLFLNHWTKQHDKQAGITLSTGVEFIWWIRKQNTKDTGSQWSNYATASNADSERTS